jgi:hypothetical protein
MRGRKLAKVHGAPHSLRPLANDISERHTATGEMLRTTSSSVVVQMVASRDQCPCVGCPILRMPRRNLRHPHVVS